MITVSVFFGIVAAICLIPSLYRGAVQDLKEFKFSEAHFNTYWINAAFVCVILMYIALVSEGLWFLAVEFFVLSILALLGFSFIAFRYGGGGDWRALIYIACIAPFVFIQAIVAAAVCGMVQAIYWVLRTDIETPAMYRKIPFALSILAGYLISLIWFIVTVL